MIVNWWWWWLKIIDEVFVDGVNDIGNLAMCVVNYECSLRILMTMKTQTNSIIDFVTPKVLEERKW